MRNRRRSFNHRLQAGNRSLDWQFGHTSTAPVGDAPMG
jgi:hypothetical protein